MRLTDVQKGRQMRLKFFILTIFLTGVLLCPGVGLGEDAAYNSGSRRDPFVPQLGGSAAVGDHRGKASDLSIDGIIYDPVGGSIVIIKGEYLKVGSQYKDVTIVSILKNRVVIRQNEAEKELWIRDEAADNKNIRNSSKS
jgi:hypothetical protein